jgi:uncharacterized membrane protein YjfL (UPF0719 family)
VTVSEDEIFVLVICLGLAASFWILWFRDVLAVALRSSGFRERWLLGVAPFAGGALLFWILRRYAASDVRDSGFYLFFYMAMGAAWVGVAARLLPFFGMGARDDVIERGNRAAALAITGALLGITLCFAGGNIGDGPGWWVVVFCGILSTGALLVFWSFLDRLTGLADAITIDRDRAAGVRAAGFFLAAGLILGRAVAGDWEGAAPAMLDFVRHGWPVAVLLAAAALLERRLRPSPETLDRPVLTHGVLPSLVYLSLGAAAVEMAGSWM